MRASALPNRNKYERLHKSLRTTIPVKKGPGTSMKRYLSGVVLSWSTLLMLWCHQTGFSQSIKPKYPLPDPKHKVRLEPSHMIPMRDGVRLSTDLYFPENASGKLPVILIRTPYNKNGYRRDNSPTYIFEGQEYIVAVQDVRAKYESEGGEYIVSAADTQDGNDAID